ncbi:MAG: hypothetical protein R2800_09885 [Flavipsychrobacter sp.]
MLSRHDKQAMELWHLKCAEIKAATGEIAVEAKEVKEKRIKRLLKDYRAFVNYYFPHYADADSADFHVKFANACKANKKFKGIAEWAREHAKSVHVTVFIPMWLKACGELTGMLLASVNKDAACELLSDVQAELVSNEKYINDFGKQAKHGSWADGKFICEDGTFFRAIGRGESPRGKRNREKRPNYGVIDDIDDDVIVRNERRVDDVLDWILGAFLGALSIKGGRLVVANNRIHKKSILAKLAGDIEPGDPKRKGWYHSKVNALDENGQPSWWQRYTLQDILDRINEMGYRMAQKELFNNPIIEGKVFKNEWIKWGKIPSLYDMESVVAYFDPSFKSTKKNDYKAIRIWGKKGKYFYLIASFVRQCTIMEACRWVYGWYSDNITDSEGREAVVPFYMEANFMQDMLLDEFENQGEIEGWQLPVRGDKRAKPDKFARIENMTPVYERGRSIWDERLKNDPDTQTGLEQLLAIQPGSDTHDDAPDADEGAWWLLNRRTKQSKTKRRVGKRQSPSQY